MNDYIKWMQSIGTAYIAIGFVMAVAFTFFAVCAGVWLLRNSKQTKQQRDGIRQEQFQSGRDQYESDDKDVRDSHEAQGQQPKEAKAEREIQDAEDQKYWPPSAK